MSTQLDLFTGPILEEAIRYFIYSDFIECQSVLMDTEFWQSIERLSNTSLKALYREVASQRIDAFGNDNAYTVAVGFLMGLRGILEKRKLEAWS